MIGKLNRPTAIVGLIVALYITLPLSAHGREAWSLALIRMDHDEFWSYDMGSHVVGATNADWPVTMVFTGNVTVTKVHSEFGGVASNADVMSASVRDYPAARAWVDDQGVKYPGGLCSANVFDHMRVYAPDDRFINIPWGQYVIATTHVDLQECSRNPTYGYSQFAETYWANEAKKKGWTVNKDSIALGNWEGDPHYPPDGKHARIETEHDLIGRTKTYAWLNDGAATRVIVPAPGP